LATLAITSEGDTLFSSDTLTLPASLANDVTAQQQWLLEQLPDANEESELPFLGGLMGYWSYDLGRDLADIASQHPAATHLPSLRVGL
ncbi:MAG TPA: aminodeoxychorismate synthase component I, partial [Halomonas sp.]|nr:aminodeoxychorismate synthase component I [Halomonas sp.]